MKTKQTVDKLWRELQDTLHKAYQDNPTKNRLLRDYAPNTGWRDSLAELVGRESANERQHRKGYPRAFVPLSVETASKLILLGNIATGAKQTTMPEAIIFIEFRRTAAEGILLGYLLREHLSTEWIAKATELDYSKEMAA
jgi:hypothetical protein